MEIAKRSNFIFRKYSKLEQNFKADFKGVAEIFKGIWIAQKKARAPRRVFAGVWQGREALNTIKIGFEILLRFGVFPENKVAPFSLLQIFLTPKIDHSLFF